MNRIFLYFISTLCALSFPACSRENCPDGQEGVFGEEIVVGSVMADGVDFTLSGKTKSTDAADKLTWLVPPLKNGLLITYWKSDMESTKKMTRLKLQMDGNDVKRDVDGFPVYDILYENDQTKAVWYGNGNHYFQGVYAPEGLRDGAVPADLTVDQHCDDSLATPGNYTLLSRYLSMPASCTVAAATSRVSLPFNHRLSKVVFYILIDTSLVDRTTSQRATIKGYQIVDGRDDPTTSEIRFNKVKVLEKVNVEVSSDGDTTFVPKWTTASSIIPHFVAERGSIGSDGKVLDTASCIVYYNTHNRNYVYPCDTKWNEAKEKYDADPQNSGYEKISYGKVPCYDLIVKPSAELYDEGGSGSTDRNQFISSMTLSNGLSLSSTVSIKPGVNQQVTVYVRIDNETVNIQASEPYLWDEDSNEDDYYGVDNRNGHSLSVSGSSWQRAFRNQTLTDDQVTDGHFYNTDSEGDGQCLKDSMWIKKFAKAVKDSLYHGDYFILAGDITIDTDKLPDPFIFTGHLDADGHTVTLTGSRNNLFAGLNGIYSTKQETVSDYSGVWEANVHKENGVWIPWKSDTAGYRAEVLNLVMSEGKTVFPDSTYSAGAYTDAVTGNVYNCKKTVSGALTAIPDHNPGLPAY